MAGTASAPSTAPVMFVWGDDDFAVQKRAKEIWATWLAENRDSDNETIEGSAGNVDEAQKVVAKVREALQTLPFFACAFSCANKPADPGPGSPTPDLHSLPKPREHCENRLTHQDR